MNNCDCALCKNNHAFDLSEDLVNEFINGNVVLFVGAGVSTENRNVLKFTFYDEIISELKDVGKLSFPEVMEKYCSKPNGRIKLLSKIKGRFQHIDSFPELYRSSTRFHENLATFFPVNTIITTNWDNYFEKECKAIPFVFDQDLAFWETTERKVLKIHGSISNYGSIVATSQDYEKCQTRLHSDIIGSVLKTLLATKTIVFVGYSLTDSDFINIYEFVSQQMQAFKRQAFVISPFQDECKKFKTKGLHPINTDGTYFFSELKKHCVQLGLMLSDNIYNEASMMKSIVNDEHSYFHEKLTCFTAPQMIYATSYQDGLLHAFERVCEMRGSGEYSRHDRIASVINGYEKIRKEKLRDKRYDDVAYIEGYMNALIFLILEKKFKDKIKSFPLYFAFGYKKDLVCFNDYKKIIKQLPKLHQASFKAASKIVGSLTSKSGVVFHHPPWL